MRRQSLDLSLVFDCLYLLFVFLAIFFLWFFYENFGELLEDFCEV